MDTEAMREWAYWDGLDGEDIDLNTAGLPSYPAGIVGSNLAVRFMYDIPDGPVLDLGCGTGRLTVELSARYFPREFFAVDISQRMLDRVDARCLPNVKTFLCDGRTLPDFGPIAGAFSVTVLQHLPHEAQESYIFQVAQRLLPGGRFVFTIAPGSEDQFLTHQVPDRALLDHWCWRAGLEVLAVEHQDPDTGWTWVETAVKP
jgi:SAM-dependent methyltransferase